MGAFLDNTGLTTLVQLIKGSLPTKATSSTIGLVKPDNSTITVDSDGVISSSGGGTDMLIYAMEQPTTSPDLPGVVRITNSNTWEEFVEYLLAGKVLYVKEATSFTFNSNYRINAQLLGVNTLYAMNIDAISIPMMSSSVSAYSQQGTQVYYSTYYYFDGVRLWSWTKPQELGNYIKVSYKNNNNYALGHAIMDINTEIGTKLTAPAAPTTDGNYVLKCSVVSGTPTYSWVSET